jgi:hypothetical protein
MAKLNISNIGPMNNVIINGDMGIWQRGTSFTSPATNAKTADRWKVEYSGPVRVNAIRSTTVPTLAQSGHLSNYSFYTIITTPDAAIAAGDYLAYTYIVEGYDVHPLMGHNITLSFWVKALAEGTYCVSFRNSGSDRSYVVDYTLASDVWTKVTMTVPMTETGGTWDYTNGLGLVIWFTAASGSTYQTAPDTWTTGNYIASTNITNNIDTTSDHFRLAQVKLERGTVATPYTSRPFEEELALCQRYYEKSYAFDEAVGSAGDGYIHLECPAAYTTRAVTYGGAHFKVEKRSIPTVVVMDEAGTVNEISQYNNATNYTVSGVNSPSRSAAFARLDMTDTLSLSMTYKCYWTADAEL